MIVDLLYLVNREWAFLGSLGLNLLPLQGPQVQFENPIWVALFKVNVVVLAQLTIASENVISVSNQGPASISTYIRSNVLKKLISGLFKKPHGILPSSSHSLWSSSSRWRMSTFWRMWQTSKCNGWSWLRIKNFWGIMRNKKDRVFLVIFKIISLLCIYFQHFHFLSLLSTFSIPVQQILVNIKIHRAVCKI